MTDLDNTQIISADDSLLQNTSIVDSEASLTIVSGTDSNTYQIGKETIIGRANPSDLVISAPSLSKQHAKITINNGQYFITDLGSSNKTFHNKVQLQPNVCYALHDGDEVKFGDVICSFQQQKQVQTEKNTFSEPTYQTYVPVANTLVEEDSPWSMDDDIPQTVIATSNVDVIPSTQTISDSYDDQEPTQPMKIWNGNPTNGLIRTSIKSSEDESLKQNGLNESSTNSSSAFIPQTTSSTVDNDDGEIIGATTLPATVPIIMESTQIDNDDQIEVISTTRTEKTIEEEDDKIVIKTTTTTTEIEIATTQAPESEPTDIEAKADEQIAETQSYDMESDQVVTDIVETKREEVHQVFVEGDKIVEEDIITTTTTTTTITETDSVPMEAIADEVQSLTEETTKTTVTETDNMPMETQAYDLEPAAEEITTTTTTTTIVTETENLPAETQAYDLEEATCSKTENLPAETQVYDLQPTEEDTKATTSAGESENLPTETLAYDLQPTNEEAPTTDTIVEDTPSKVEESEKIVEEEQPLVEPSTSDVPAAETDNQTSNIAETVDAPMETQAYDLEPSNEQTGKETTPSAVCVDTQQYDLKEEVEDSSPRPASETCEVVPISELVEQLQNAENVSDDSTPKQQVEVTIDTDRIEKEIENEQMETEQTEPEAEVILDEVPTVAEQQPEESVKEEVPITTDANAATSSETEQPEEPVQEPVVQQETTSVAEPEQKLDESIPAPVSEVLPSSAVDTTDTQAEEAEANEEDGQEEEGEEEEEAVESAPVPGRSQRGMPRRAARRARGRRAATSRTRVVSTRLHSTRRNATATATVTNESNNTTLEETVNTEAEESPRKSTAPVVELKRTDTQPVSEPTPPATENSSPNQANTSSNIRVSARIKARASSGRNRQFPYTDDYVDLDDLEKQSKAAATPTTPTPTAPSGRRSARGGRSSSASQKRISLRQQPIDSSESPEEKSKKQKGSVDVYEQMDTGGENEEPTLPRRTPSRKRKSTTPVSPIAPTTTSAKRTRSATPQSAPAVTTRGKQAAATTTPTTTTTADSSSSVTPKRGRKSAKLETPAAEPSEKEESISDRPVRIALSSHLNFDQTHLDALRKLGFDIMDESCHVDALVVDRIRRTKKFFMCLARGALILSPSWIETMIKENRYLPYEKYYLEDTNAETRYGFQLRESVRLAKQRPIFESYKIFCTKDTSPPYDDLKDIVEAAGGKFIDKINFNKPGKDLICIVAQTHKTEYENLHKKGVPIVSEEFALSGISKQKLDFDAFSLFQPAASTSKPSGSK